MNVPVGFRKAISKRAAVACLLIQEGRCTTCGEKLTSVDDCEFDHVPALKLRRWNEVVRDTEPPSNDPAFMEAKHGDCHDVKTFGKGGTKRVTTAGSDIHAISKAKRINRKQEDFRRSLQNKAEGASVEEIGRPKPKSKIQSRPFQKGRGFQTPTKRRLAK